MKSIVFLSTYPFAKPRHGGQIRLSQLVNKFSNNGWTARSIAIYEQESFIGDDLGPYDIPFPIDSEFRKFEGRNIPLINDLLTAEFAVSDRDTFSKVVSHLPDHIDVIHVEQCWLWDLAKKIKALDKFKKAILIFGSQNIEYLLKKDILEQYNIPDHHEVIDKIQSLEIKATVEADIIAAVTENDAKIMASWGGGKVILAANGIKPWDLSYNNTNKNKWIEKLPKSPWMLYIASAHPPNFTSFIKIIGESLACIPPDSKLVIAGSVCEHIYREVSDSKWTSINMSRLELLYVLDDNDLGIVKNLAHAYFLPIEHGGGSNLKTAEALYSGKYVIGTASAFRGFEDYINSTRVKIVNSPQDFHISSRNILSSPTPVLNDEEKEIMQKLTWDRTLEGLFSDVEKFMEQQ
ncbi:MULTISPECIES: hypothetical protein [unclassified Pantoea]|uniref:hypothetical protein n=1 Tax=unclassified Pantoea TaxID=2630326 RepID=UPI001FA9E22C|nr:hypothetical protein [Pantoea sp. MQR6]